MQRYAFDCETNGLVHQLDKIHSLVLRDLDTGDIISCADQEGYEPICNGIHLLMGADLLAGHNIINFDFRALKKVYPGFKKKPSCILCDTLIFSRVLWPELEPVDEQKFSHIDTKHKGRHSLGAWGDRLNVNKTSLSEEGESKWDVWSEEMQKYCENDTLVSLKLYEYFLAQKIDSRCYELEHSFAIIMTLQEDFGFPFNEKAAYALVNTLKTRHTEIDEQLQKVFPPIIEERLSTKTGRRLKDKITTFNPASRKQTADRLQEHHPEIRFDRTEKGNVKVDDDVLKILGKKYPEAALLEEYQLLNKRLGQISEGKEAWLKHSQKYKDGRIHGSVITNACVSGRCSHRGPNMAQIPRVGHKYGAECRALFYAPNGWIQIGADASGLELRALGAQLAYFDGGEYAKLVSIDDFDIHTHNAKLFGIFDGKGKIDKKTRELAKTLIYAVLYGAGAKKLGSILDISLSEYKQQEIGRETINTFYKNLPAIVKLKDKVDERVIQRGYLTGIDGRHLQIRSRHSALNQLLQSTGAIAVKKATCILYKDLYEAGLKWSCHFAFIAHIHDEIQALVKPQFVNLYKSLAIDSFRKAGEFYNLKCPLTGEAKEGKNWMETH
jgi:DNA polymerase I-like protein with 3'-5' exonuclease and polymerase domains